jgi:hypothetical protein
VVNLPLVMGHLGLQPKPTNGNPPFTGPSQPSGLIPEYDPSINVWLVPFPMAPINTKNVHRTI